MNPFCTNEERRRSNVPVLFHKCTQKESQHLGGFTTHVTCVRAFCGFGISERLSEAGTRASKQASTQESAQVSTSHCLSSPSHPGMAKHSLGQLQQCLCDQKSESEPNRRFSRTQTAKLRVFKSRRHVWQQREGHIAHEQKKDHHPKAPKVAQVRVTLEDHLASC